ncbi:MAG TPA: MFS transporter [Bauldia sp.]|nr:MFS transporter [Bauldia sp.]
MSSRKTILAVVFCIVLVDIMGYGLLLPILPQLVQQMLGGDVASASTTYGLLVAAFSLMNFIFSPLLGALADRFGRRPVLLLSLFGLCIDYLILAFAPSVGWLFLGRIVAGICSATLAVTSAVIADTTPIEKRAAAFGVTGAAIGLGFIAGPLFGGLLGELGARMPFFAAAALALGNFAWTWFSLPETLKPEDRRSFRLADANPIGAIASAAHSRVIVVLFVVCVLMNLSARMLESTWVLFTGYRFAWGAFEVGMSLAVFGLFFAGFQGFIVRFLARGIGEWATLLLGLAVGAGALTIFGMATAPWAMYATILPYAFGAAVTGPSLQAIATRNARRDEQGLLQGAIASLITATGVIGPPIGAFLFGHFVGEESALDLPGIAFFAGAGLLVVAFLTMILQRKRIPHEHV